MGLAIICTVLGALLDYFNPRTRFLDWLAAWFYMPAALAWVNVLGVKSITDEIGTPYIRWGASMVCLFLTAMLFNSMITWKLFILRKIITPISEQVTGLGGSAHSGFNGRLIGVIAAAAVLSLVPLPKGVPAQGFIDATHSTVRAIGDRGAQKIGVGWLGFPGDIKSGSTKGGGRG